MPGQYRLEVSPTNRAGCQNVECKQNGIKIQKGEVRLGVFVTIQDNQTWRWKHWGCVTPVQIKSIHESIEDNLDLLDGFEDLPEHDQARVKKALQDGHVADEDWRGDVEMNRPGMRGFRTPTHKKEMKEAKKQEVDQGDGQEAAEALSPSKPEPKKRGRAKKVAEDNDEDVEPAPKKAKPAPKKGRKVKTEDRSNADADGDIEPAPKKATAASRRPKVKAEANSDPEATEEDVKPSAKKVKEAPKQGKKVKQEDGPEQNEVGITEAAPTKSNSRKTKKAQQEDGAGEPEAAHKAKSRGKKGARKGSEAQQNDEEPMTTGKGRANSKAKTTKAASKAAEGKRSSRSKATVNYADADGDDEDE